MLEKTYFQSQDPLYKKEITYKSLVDKLISTLDKDNEDDTLLINILSCQGYLPTSLYKKQSVNIHPNLDKFYKDFIQDVYELDCTTLCTISVYQLSIEPKDTNVLNTPYLIFPSQMSMLQHWTYLYSFDGIFHEYEIYENKINHILLNSKSYLNDIISINMIFANFLKNVVLYNDYNQVENKHSIKFKILMAGYTTTLAYVYITYSYKYSPDHPKMTTMKKLLDFLLNNY